MGEIYEQVKKYCKEKGCLCPPEDYVLMAIANTEAWLRFYIEAQAKIGAEESFKRKLGRFIFTHPNIDDLLNSKGEYHKDFLKFEEELKGGDTAIEKRQTSSKAKQVKVKFKVREGGQND